VDYTDYDTRLAAYAVILDGPSILLALWNEAAEPEWTMPGGGVELHESVEEAAVREVREETGYDVRLGRLLGVDSFLIPGHRRNNGSGRVLKSVRVVFEAEVVGGELTREVGGTTDEARWIPLEEVRSLRRVPLVDRSLRMAGLV
jgi:8-oxo-dGTP diphosphatase